MWDPDQIIQSELDPSEVLRWIGKPAVVRVLFANAPKICFSLIWESLLIYVAGKMLTSGTARTSAQVFPLGITSLMLIFGAFFIAGAVAPVLASLRTVYGVTSGRVLTVSAFTKRRVRSVTAAAIGGIERTDQPDGSGNIVVLQGGQGGDALALIGVPDVRSVANRIERLRENAAVVSSVAGGPSKA